VRAIAFALALALGAAAPAAPAAADEPLVVRGTVLTVDASYLVFTTGDAVRLGNFCVDRKRAWLGTDVLVVLDPATHAVTKLAVDPGPRRPEEIDASALPRAYVAVDPATAQTAPASRSGGAIGGIVTVTISVSVPVDTPPSDDVYLATDRTNFSPAELRMNRVDAHRWTVSLDLPAAATLRYLFTRGSYATVERSQSGAIAVPRTLSPATARRVDDAVARWADST
jgi:hypothetical protein